MGEPRRGDAHSVGHHPRCSYGSWSRSLWSALWPRIPTWVISSGDRWNDYEEERADWISSAEAEREVWLAPVLCRLFNEERRTRLDSTSPEARVCVCGKPRRRRSRCSRGTRYRYQCRLQIMLLQIMDQLVFLEESKEAPSYYGKQSLSQRMRVRRVFSDFSGNIFYIAP